MIMISEKKEKSSCLTLFEMQIWQNPTNVDVSHKCGKRGQKDKMLIILDGCLV